MQIAPVLGDVGRLAGLDGFLSGQCSTAAGAEQLSDILSSGGPRCVLPGQGSTAAGAEQIADIPSSGGPHGFLPGQVSMAFLGAEHGHDGHGHGALHGSPPRLRSCCWSSRLCPGTEFNSSSCGCARGGLPPSGCSTVTPLRASPITGTDIPMRLPGSHLRASRSSGLVRGGGIWFWHRGTRVSTYELPPLPPE